ncbi:hypothetical protein N7470_002235 [Penicillium chermesinum]|nr:hypothetical protein N7470_002235 [Penicillium chermesinum]
MDLSSVSFTVSTSADYTWLAHPNTSTANEVLYLNSSGPEVGLTSSNDTQGKLTSIWWTYGGYVMTKVHNASFYAEPIFDTPGWYSLGWSAEDGGTDKVLVTLRTAKPSTYAVLGQPTL